MVFYYCILYKKRGELICTEVMVQLVVYMETYMEVQVLQVH